MKYFKTFIAYNYPARMLVVAVSLIYFSTNAHLASAQESTIHRTNYYYLDFNSSEPSRIAAIQNELLSIKYNDTYGQSSELPLKIYDWRHEEIASFTLQKTFGTNYYNIDLKEVYTGWEINQVYSCEAVNEVGRKYKLLFKPVAPPEKDGPEASIFVNPINLQCDDLSNAALEFYGQIQGGKAPYKIHWYVVNEQQTGLIYQPREEDIMRAGNTPVVYVDAQPDYYILLIVTDACGYEEKQMVHVVCDNGEDKVHTIFVQPLNGIPSHTTSGN